MIYIAQPYSHDDPAVMTERFNDALLWCARLHKQYPFSPIAHWHHVSLDHDLPYDADYWLEYNYHMLEHAEAMYILLLNGWNTSRGLAAEVAHASRFNIPTHTIDPASEIRTLINPRLFLKRLKYGKHYSKRLANVRVVK